MLRRSISVAPARAAAGRIARLGAAAPAPLAPAVVTGGARELSFLELVIVAGAGALAMKAYQQMQQGQAMQQQQQYMYGQQGPPRGRLHAPPPGAVAPGPQYGVPGYGYGGGPSMMGTMAAAAAGTMAGHAIANQFHGHHGADPGAAQMPPPTYDPHAASQAAMGGGDSWGGRNDPAWGGGGDSWGSGWGGGGGDGGGFGGGDGGGGE